MAARARVFSGYRRLFRARKQLFDGDDRAMRESRVAIRAEFLKNSHVETSGPHWEGLLTMIDEAEDMLRTGFVRGELNRNTGRYEVKLKAEHADKVHEPPKGVQPPQPPSPSGQSSEPTVIVTQYTPQNAQR